MRKLPTKRSERQNLIIKAVEDFCGDDTSSNRNVVNAALWIMGRRRGVVLNDYEKDIVWYVLANIADPTYCKSLSSNDTTTHFFDEKDHF